MVKLEHITPFGSTTLNRDLGDLRRKRTNLGFLSHQLLMLTAKYGGAKSFSPISGIAQKGCFCSTVKCSPTLHFSIT